MEQTVKTMSNVEWAPLSLGRCLLAIWPFGTSYCVEEQTRKRRKIRGNTPLHCRKGHLAIGQALISGGANIFAFHNLRDFPIH
jgi:hypothetical protein